MTGNSVAMDTNWAIDVPNGAPGIQPWLDPFARFCLPVPGVGELRCGALNSRHSMQNLRRVDELLALSDVLDITAQTAGVYADVRMKLKIAGRPIPENDV